MATQVVKYFMLAQNRCQSLQSWKGAKSKCLETLRAFDLFRWAQKTGGRNPDRQLNNWMKWLNCCKQPFLFELFLFSSRFIQRQFLPPANNPQAQRDCVRPTTWVKGSPASTNSSGYCQYSPFAAQQSWKGHKPSFWICLRLTCLEKVKHILPNGGERWWWIPWYKINIPLKQLQIISGFHVQFRWENDLKCLNKCANVCKPYRIGPTTFPFAVHWGDTQFAAFFFLMSFSFIENHPNFKSLNWWCWLFVLKRSLKFQVVTTESTHQTSRRVLFFDENIFVKQTFCVATFIVDLIPLCFLENTITPYTAHCVWSIQEAWIPARYPPFHQFLLVIFINFALIHFISRRKFGDFDPSISCWSHFCWRVSYISNGYLDFFHQITTGEPLVVQVARQFGRFPRIVFTTKLANQHQSLLGLFLSQAASRQSSR